MDASVLSSRILYLFIQEVYLLMVFSGALPIELIVCDSVNESAPNSDFVFLVFYSNWPYLFADPSL